MLQISNINIGEIVTIIVAMGGLLGWFVRRLDKKFDQIDKKFDLIDKQLSVRFDKIDEKFEKIDLRLQALDMRLTCMEGRFEERGYWESRELRKTGTEDKK